MTCFIRSNYILNNLFVRVPHCVREYLKMTVAPANVFGNDIYLLCVITDPHHRQTRNLLSCKVRDTYIR